MIADYAIALAKGILPYKPHWLEEPLRPDDLEGYTRLKGETGIVLAAGEHWYTRWNVKPFLDRRPSASCSRTRNGAAGSASG